MPRTHRIAPARLLPVALVAATALGALAACSDAQSASTPRIVVTPTTLVFNSVPLGQTDVLDVLVENEGSATLRVTNVRVSASTDFVRLQDPTRSSFEVEPGDAMFVSFEFAPTAPEPTDGQVIFVTNDPQNSELAIAIDTPVPQPAPAVVPAILDFGVSAVNVESTIDVELRNIGLAPLIVCDAQVTGSGEIGGDVEDVVAAAVDPDLGYAVVDLYDFDTGVGVRSLEFELTYLPIAPGDDSAVLLLEYDELGDVDTPCLEENRQLAQYDISGTAGTALLGRDPCPLDFRERAIDVTHEEVVTLQNLGALPLDVFDVRIDRNRTAASFDLGELPELPVSLPASESMAFSVTYRPDTLAAEAGVVLIEHSDEAGTRVTSECRLAGVGVENDCPIAVATGWVLEDSENRRGSAIDWALPLQTLVLDGSASYDPAGDEIVDYFWEIEAAPDAAINGIRAFSGDPGNPAMAEYFLPLAGQYRICLSVVDSTGLECERSCVTVVAIPEEALAIELTWDNPTDPDQTDQDGSDVDLHLVKMPAAWFDSLYDTYYGNQTPVWSPENPSLDIDDTDGVGPETIQLDDPANCQWYAIGAHYFTEAYGTAWPSVKIYVDGRQVDEIISQPLFEEDYFWDVARVHWPSGTVYRVNEVIEAFDSREGIAPRVTDQMRASGLCDSSGS